MLTARRVGLTFVLSALAAALVPALVHCGNDDPSEFGPGTVDGGESTSSSSNGGFQNNGDAQLRSAITGSQEYYERSIVRFPGAQP